MNLVDEIIAAAETVTPEQYVDVHVPDGPVEIKNLPLGRTKCGNLVSCTCDLVAHRDDCRFRRAASLSFELACKHGFQACPQCDPCACGTQDFFLFPKQTRMTRLRAALQGVAGMR